MQYTTELYANDTTAIILEENINNLKINVAELMNELDKGLGN